MLKAASIVETLDQVRNAPPLQPSALAPKLPTDLETICLKCLEKQPGRRYPSAASVADELDRFLNNQPIIARPVGRIERGIRWCQRNRAVAALGGLVLLTFLVGALASTLFAIQASIRARDAEAIPDARRMAGGRTRCQRFTFPDTTSRYTAAGKASSKNCAKLLRLAKGPQLSGYSLERIQRIFPGEV